MRPCVATVGFFDGVHRGHRYLIRHITETARSMGLESTVVTFDRHPRQVLHSDFVPQLLSTAEEKLALLSQTGADNCVVLPFDGSMAAMSAHDFMGSILRDRLKVKILVTGYDNRFGHDRTEGFGEYVAYGHELGIDVRQWQPLVLDGVNISSSVTRTLLQAGEAEAAARCLGYPYTIVGKVVEGEHIGTGMGFPTANLQPADSHKLVPAAGVYAVRVRLAGAGQLLPGMTNIGCRPTFGGGKTTIETHILCFGGNIYGEQMGVSFISRLRAEKKFRSSAELTRQLWKDMREAESLLTEDAENRNESSQRDGC